MKRTWVPIEALRRFDTGDLHATHDQHDMFLLSAAGSRVSLATYKSRRFRIANVDDGVLGL